MIELGLKRKQCPLPITPLAYRTCKGQNTLKIFNQNQKQIQVREGIQRGEKIISVFAAAELLINNILLLQCGNERILECVCVAKLKANQA